MEVLTFDNVRLEFDGALAIIVMADADHLNALSPAMADGMMLALQEASKPRRGVRALMLTGEGRGFCAGANLSGRADDFGGKPPVLGRVEAVFHPLVRRLRDFEKPVVAAVNGPCIGIGLALSLQTDCIVASESAYFATPFARLGSSPDGGLTWTLPRVVGPFRARRLLMGQERISPTEAETWGLVSRVLPEGGFPEAAKAVAMEFANGPTVALSQMRRLLQDGLRGEFETQLEAEIRALGKTFRSKDNLIGMKAYAGKTEPHFTGE